MNTNSLLLGSAAIALVTSGARAADAIAIAEPERAEYVKVCDTYGAGYFYLPGTQTCLRIGGYLRYDAGAGDIGSFDGVEAIGDRDGSIDNTWKKNARFSLKTWTAQETELGTLKTYTETRFNFGNTTNSGLGLDPNGFGAYNKPPSLNFAWIQLGGLRIGKDESAFDTFIGYAGNVIQWTLIPFGNFDTNVLQYYFDGDNGFSGVVSLEEGSGKTGTIDSYVPHVVGGVKYAQDWGAITGVASYESNYNEVASKLRLDVKATQQLSLWIMGGYGTDNNLLTFVGDGGRGFYKQWYGHWAVWGGGTYKFNEKVSFNTQISYDQGNNLGVAANIAYMIVPGYTITTEVDYLRAGKFGQADFSNWTSADKKNSVGGIVRFQRSF